MYEIKEQHASFQWTSHLTSQTQLSHRKKKKAPKVDGFCGYLQLKFL